MSRRCAKISLAACTLRPPELCLSNTLMVAGITGVTSTVGDVPQAEAAAKYYSYTLQPFHRQAINRGTLGIRYADKGKKGWRFARVAYRNQISTFGVCYIDTKMTGVSTVNKKLLLTTNAR